MMPLSAALALLVTISLQATPVAPSAALVFTLESSAEVVATITAGCRACDWGEAGREAVLLEVTIDGSYSQHVPLVRGAAPTPYRILLGPLARGAHRLVVTGDRARSSPRAGPASIESLRIDPFVESDPEYERVAHAPLLRARSHSIERFSDVPLLLYVEAHVTGERGHPFRLQYTAIFSNEDGGTPTDRLMATWGRTTDVEFVYGLTDETPARALIQAAGHEWIPFAGPRTGEHPELWVATDNNMVADSGSDTAIRFAPAPVFVSLDGTSREAVMDAEPWTYAVTSGEMRREGRLDPDAAPKSGRIPDPRRYAVVEACGEMTDAMLAFDVGVRGASGAIEWFASDRGEPSFRIARRGCFRGAAPLRDGTRAKDIAGLRLRAYTRPPREGEQALPRGSGRVTLSRVNRVFMLDADYTPQSSALRWEGALAVPTDSGPVEIPANRRERPSPARFRR